MILELPPPEVVIPTYPAPLTAAIVDDRITPLPRARLVSLRGDRALLKINDGSRYMGIARIDNASIAAAWLECEVGLLIWRDGKGSREIVFLSSERVGIAPCSEDVSPVEYRIADDLTLGFLKENYGKLVRIVLIRVP